MEYFTKEQLKAMSEYDSGTHAPSTLEKHEWAMNLYVPWCKV